jgi:excisionase family DNA binding protein
VTDAPEPLVDARVAAPLVGTSVPSLLRWAARGEIPNYRLGTGRRQLVRFRVSELQRWIEARRVRPVGSVPIRRSL